MTLLMSGLRTFFDPMMPSNDEANLYRAANRAKPGVGPPSLDFAYMYRRQSRG